MARRPVQQSFVEMAAAQEKKLAAAAIPTEAKEQQDYFAWVRRRQIEDAILAGVTTPELEVAARDRFFSQHAAECLRKRKRIGKPLWFYSEAVSRHHGFYAHIYHVPNGLRTFAQAARSIKLQGLRRGIYDIIVDWPWTGQGVVLKAARDNSVLPWALAMVRTEVPGLLFAYTPILCGLRIDLKRRKGGRGERDADQLVWQERWRRQGFAAEFARGHEEAIDLTEAYREGRLWCQGGTVRGWEGGR